jgi:hypothetical protein
MTLDTRVYVHGPVDHRELFLRCNQLIGATERTRCEDKQDEEYRDGEWVTVPGGPHTIMNEPDQGLPGWLMIHYRPGAPLRTEAQTGEHDSDCDGEDDCSWNHRRPCYAEVSIDTAYSYRDELGGSGDLHARFVAALGEWLDSKGIRWQWENEFTGEVFWGTERLGDLGKSGADAADWLRGTVLPALAGRMLEG